MADPIQTAADAVKLFAKANITVRMPVLDKKGNPQRDPDTKRFVMGDEKLSESHVMGFRDLGDEVSITVADGKKYQASKAAK